MHGIYALDVWSLWCRCSISVVAQQLHQAKAIMLFNLGCCVIYAVDVLSVVRCMVSML